MSIHTRALLPGCFFLYFVARPVEKVFAERSGLPITAGATAGFFAT